MFFVIGLACVFSLTLAISLIVRYYVKNIFNKRHTLNDTSLVGLRDNNNNNNISNYGDNNSLGTLSSSNYESVIAKTRFTISSKIEPIFKPMISSSQNDLKLTKKSSIYPLVLSNPIYNDVSADAGNTDLFTDVYITNSNQDTKQFNGPNYDNSGIKPVQNSSKTWEQLQIEKSLNK
jgi:hypothetical protein